MRGCDYTTSQKLYIAVLFASLDFGIILPVRTFLATTAFICISATQGAEITRLEDLVASRNALQSGRGFDLSAKLVMPPNGWQAPFFVTDATNHLMMVDCRSIKTTGYQPGDVVQLSGYTGYTDKNELDHTAVFSYVTNLLLIAHGTPPSHPPGNDLDLAKVPCDTPVTATGQLIGSFQDIYGEDYLCAILQDSGKRINVSFRKNGIANDPFEKLAGYVISIRGVYTNPFANKDTNQVLFFTDRSIANIKVLKCPPFWTTTRLSLVIAALLLILIVGASWIVALQKVSTRKGHALYLAKKAEADAKLRTEERTRLAAELHDYHAQNLMAVSYRLATAERKRISDPELSARALGEAAKILDASRIELRHCLWDLRNDALDEPDFNAAIQKTLLMFRESSVIRIRFNVALNQVPNQVAHAALAIIRELVHNAINHGGAGQIIIAGEFKDGLLRFVVRDDGRGFDPEQRPTIAQGHFGLSGAMNRAQRYGGSVQVESSTGKGTTISVSLKCNCSP